MKKINFFRVLALSILWVYIGALFIQVSVMDISVPRTILNCILMLTTSISILSLLAGANSYLAYLAALYMRIVTIVIVSMVIYLTRDRVADYSVFFTLELFVTGYISVYLLRPATAPPTHPAH